MLAEQYGGQGWRTGAMLGLFGSVTAWGLYDVFKARPEDQPDPFGRGWLTAIRHRRAAKAARGRELSWTSATVETCPRELWDQLSSAIGMAPDAIAHDGERTWLAAERDWWGWPDPPRYVVVAFGSDGALVAAVDLNKWPEKWNHPAGFAKD